MGVPGTVLPMPAFGPRAGGGGACARLPRGQTRDQRKAGLAARALSRDRLAQPSTARADVVEWSNDVSAADWIVDRLHRFPSDVAWDVGSFVPDGFPAYARSLHPAWRTEPGRRVKVRWADLARTAGPTLHATTRFEELESSAVTHDTEPPLDGTLEEDELDAFVELLAAFTSSPQSCWFGVWEGYGWMQGPPAIGEMVARRPGGGAGSVGPNGTLQSRLRPRVPACRSPADRSLSTRDRSRRPERSAEDPLRRAPTSGGRRTTPGASPQRSTSAPPTSGAPRPSSIECWTTSASKRSQPGSPTASPIEVSPPRHARLPCRLTGRPRATGPTSVIALMARDAIGRSRLIGGGCGPTRQSASFGLIRWKQLGPA